VSSAFVFILLLAGGLVFLTFWAGRRMPASQLVTGVWLGIAGVGFIVLAQSYLIVAFRVIDSGTVVFAAVPAIGVLIACIAGLFAWLRKRSLNSAYRVYALTLLAFDIVALGFMGAAAPF
jgi:hypothetical protein